MSSSVRWNERELELHEPLAPDGPSGDAVAPARSIIRSAGVATDVDARDVAGPGHGPVPDPSSGVPSDETPSRWRRAPPRSRPRASTRTCPFPGETIDEDERVYYDVAEEDPDDAFANLPAWLDRAGHHREDHPAGRGYGDVREDPANATPRVLVGAAVSAPSTRSVHLRTMPTPATATTTATIPTPATATTPTIRLRRPRSLPGGGGDARRHHQDAFRARGGVRGAETRTSRRCARSFERRRERARRGGGGARETRGGGVQSRPSVARVGVARRIGASRASRSDESARPQSRASRPLGLATRTRTRTMRRPIRPTSARTPCASLWSSPATTTSEGRA